MNAHESEPHNVVNGVYYAPALQRKPASEAPNMLGIGVARGMPFSFGTVYHFEAGDVIPEHDHTKSGGEHFTIIVEGVIEYLEGDAVKQTYRAPSVFDPDSSVPHSFRAVTAGLLVNVPTVHVDFEGMKSRAHAALVELRALIGDTQSPGGSGGEGPSTSIWGKAMRSLGMFASVFW